jgi:hypothetical protein
MAEENLGIQGIHPILVRPSIMIGDPPIILEFINQGQNEQTKQRMNSLYLDAVAEALQAQLKFVQGLRSILSSSAGG